MKKVLIATHGKLADGFKSALELLYAQNNSIEVLNAYIDETNVIDRVHRFVDSVESDDEAVIFTDLKCGSVNQLVMNQLAQSDKKIFVLTGINLALILEIMLSTHEITEEYLEEVVLLAREEISLMKLGSLYCDSEEELFG